MASSTSRFMLVSPEEEALIMEERRRKDAIEAERLRREQEEQKEKDKAFKLAYNRDANQNETDLNTALNVIRNTITVLDLEIPDFNGVVRAKQTAAQVRVLCSVADDALSWLLHLSRCRHPDVLASREKGLSIFMAVSKEVPEDIDKKIDAMLLRLENGLRAERIAAGVRDRERAAEDVGGRAGGLEAMNDEDFNKQVGILAQGERIGGEADLDDGEGGSRKRRRS